MCARGSLQVSPSFLTAVESSTETRSVCGRVLTGELSMDRAPPEQRQCKTAIPLRRTSVELFLQAKQLYVLPFYYLSLSLFHFTFSLPPQVLVRCHAKLMAKACINAPRNDVSTV